MAAHCGPPMHSPTRTYRSVITGRQWTEKSLQGYTRAIHMAKYYHVTIVFIVSEITRCRMSAINRMIQMRNQLNAPCSTGSCTKWMIVDMSEGCYHDMPSGDFLVYRRDQHRSNKHMYDSHTGPVPACPRLRLIDISVQRGIVTLWLSCK